MTRTGCAIAVALLASGSFACGGGDGSGADGGPDGDGGGKDSGVPSTIDPSNRFALESQEWSVPPNGFEEGFAQPWSATSYRYWNVFDVDGDRRIDIVQTGATDLSESAWDAGGSPYWKVFLGGSERWAGAAMEWRVPASGSPSGFFALSAIRAGGWQTFDITGDGLSDLIQTSDPETGRVWDQEASPYWKVFENGGESGFNKSPRIWPVPDSGTTDGFSATTANSSSWQWETFDIDGDGQPDLVQTSDPVTGKVWDDTGEPHWKVFHNNGESFDHDAISWSVPDSGTSEGFDTANTSVTYHWRVMDLDDDGRADLVQTSDPATGNVWDAGGEPYWKVFAGEGEGFAGSPHKWSVPPNGLGEGFYDAFSDTSWRMWSLIDIDGDRDLDLVQTGDTSHESRVWDASGDPYWKVFRNDGAGFSAELHRWPVPKSGTEFGFYQAWHSDAYTTWTLLDADADGHTDLVQTEDPSTGRVWDATGSPYWKVFYGQE